MPSTSNYGWPTPADTALVRDGADAMRDLGDAIDTTVKANADAAINATFMAAKGDLISATANDTPSILSVGSNGFVLTANSSTATGLEWVAASGGGGTPKTETFTASGTWTAPTGVVWANAIIQSGGGGGGSSNSATSGSTGGTSSAFGLTPAGGTGGNDTFKSGITITNNYNGSASVANTGEGGQAAVSLYTSLDFSRAFDGQKGGCLTTGQAVTPGTGYTITVGAGGAGGGNGASGASGFVTIFWTE